jgi:DegV family protein with EDD domain
MKIVTDCAADMPAEELAALGVTQAPLFIQFPDGEVSSADISADEFYDRLEAMHPAIPKTAQPSSGIFAQIYRQLAETDSQILSIHISSGLSGTLNSARGGADLVSPQAEVTLWDTMTLSGGERFQVMAAALAARAGWTLPAIEKRLEEIRANAEVIYTLETVEYLARGGRIGRVQALAGMLLDIKPVIRVDHADGKYSTAAKVRSMSRGLAAIVDHLYGQYANTPLWLTVLHGRLADKAEALAGQLSARLNVARLEVMRISPVLGVHTGPGIVGAAVVPMQWMEGLLQP